ncbi:hypothetical protein VMCG_00009 [Cytospora schulzeri]|uniref:Uncharacterized protein n=1 Tax=Cytospora schulzeri TaxID=448051 RepID=A0A423XAB0_9PEZI|nr:hypothetical protein VMCG_00009 [Valsa malicola]
MCIYIQTIPLCGHPPPTIHAYASCTNVLAQLMRITEAEAWEPGELDRVPFEMGDDCDPRPDNIYVLYSDDYCGWECRNNACRLAAEFGGLGGRGEDDGFGSGGMLPAYDTAGFDMERGKYMMGGGGGGAGHRPMVMGMPGAKYGPGSERLGIGWRTA